MKAVTDVLPCCRVVLAEDQPLIRKLLVLQLQDLGHTVVGSAKDGLKVVELVLQEKPDLVILDHGLPLQDGFAAAAAIATHQPTPIVLLSGYLLEDPEAVAHAVGAQVFLTKPYTVDELETAIQQALLRFAHAQADARETKIV